jgi:hypothetical protein
MTTRYCPSCDAVGGNLYTIWTGEGYDDFGPCSNCENDLYDEEDSAEYEHGTYMTKGAYRIVCNINHKINRGDANGELTITCGGEGCQCQNLFELLVDAVEFEVIVGKFDPAKWAPTFPKRVGELVAIYRGKAAAALADKLPAVLVEIIGEYFM